MKRFKDLIKIIDKLRGKNGCPWDKKQTHRSLKPYVIEEAYEMLQAIDKKDDKKLCDELGDLLLQVILHSRIAKERKAFSVEDVIKGINEKMTRRHPHVFAKRKVSGVDEVWKNWEEIKSDEAEYRSILDSIPKALPALYRAEKAQKKAARVGFDWDEIAGAWDKVREEMGEIKELLRKDSKTKALKSRLAEEIGDLLFAVVNVSRKTGINAEEALHDAVVKFSGRFRFIERHAKKSRIKLSKMNLDEMESLWKKAKKSGL
ncbi:MAG: nucleoside triphosphate pyrophosphohydrolase [Candidatus Saganbacteria bacterium]|nr:nucleoside triphosphate pyrophosphohydrolase [Candidatus Saganbacteria bacterium]